MPRDNTLITSVGSPRPGGEEVSPRPGGEEVSPRPGGEEVSPRPGGEEVSPRPGGEEVSPRPGGEEASDATKNLKDSVEQALDLIQYASERGTIIDEGLI